MIMVRFHSSTRITLSFLQPIRAILLMQHIVIFVDNATSKKHTFHELRRTSIEVGRGLIKQWNWQKGDIMAVFAPNCADIATIMSATLWAGGIVCPINNLYTVGELASLLKSSGAKAITTHVSCLEVAREAALIVGLAHNRIILIGEPDPKEIGRHFSSLRDSTNTGESVNVNPKEDLAFLVYSSGTTGLPKGVMLSHENIVANILQSCTPEAAMINWKNDSMISFLPMFHIYGKLVSQILLKISQYIEQDTDILSRNPCFNFRPPPSRSHNAHHATIRPTEFLCQHPDQQDNNRIRRPTCCTSPCKESFAG
jgi:long-subunit acyl-CoA synthetase (AMP-forming)